MARSTRLVILIKNIYIYNILWGRKRFLPPVTYFPTNLVYPFTLRVTSNIRLSEKFEAKHLKDHKKSNLLGLQARQDTVVEKETETKKALGRKWDLQGHN